jgi:squalene synthase HpnC
MAVDHYENFPVASVLLPRNLRRPVELIYAFARRADDFADEGNLPARERLALLDGFSRELDRIERGEPSQDPLFTELRGVIREHALPLGLFRDLLSAFSQDVVKARYANFAEVMDYCRRSADPVGRLLLHLYRATGAENERMSDGICSGLQLINFWQDVAIDWRKDRVYLPLDEMAEYGVTENQIAGGKTDERWRALMRFQVQRTQAMMDAGAPLGLRLPGRIGFELRMIVAGGNRILRKIAAVEGDVFRHRPVLRPFDWILMSARALART